MIVFSGTHLDATMRMRTTIKFDPDTSAAIDRVRRESGMGLSATVNHLVRQGLLNRPPAAQFKQKTYLLGLKIDVSNVAEAIDLIEGPHTR